MTGFPTWREALAVDALPMFIWSLRFLAQHGEPDNEAVLSSF